MTYDMTIGERVRTICDDEGSSWIEESDPRYAAALGAEPEGPIPWLGWDVRSIDLPEAPSFPGDELTRRSNYRSASYGGWSAFCSETRLDGLFFDREHGFANAPDGLTPLTEAHHRTIARALDRWHANHPGATPGWAPGQDPQLARLIWLQWWTRWALDHCERPTFSCT